MPTDIISAIADELHAAYENGHAVAPPSSRDGAFDLAAAYAVERELARRRVATGRQIVGRKVGFANKALWRVLTLETLAWAHMYDDTVRYADNNTATLSIAGGHSPRIEPEIVVKLATAIPHATSDAADVLAHVEWIALGFEIIDCRYPDWKYQPADFVAAYGLHCALIVGEPQQVTPDRIAMLVTELPCFKVRLSRNDEAIAEGSGKESLRSPALCIGELAGTIARASGGDSLAAGEIISTGSLTPAQPIGAGETWTAQVEGIDLPALTLRID